MTPSGLRSAPPRFRGLVAALVVVLAWAIVGPVVEAAHSHADDRCCRNGICCCKPKDVPAGPCLRGVCHCAGHDRDPSAGPVVRQVTPPAAFTLLLQLPSSELAAPPTPSPGDGFSALPFHPPRG